MTRNTGKIGKNNLRRILSQFVLDHAVDSRIPSEREISDALGLNRYSIRKHLASFEREGWLVKKGRQGMFLRFNAEISSTYGLITGDGQRFSYLDGPDMIAGALRHFSAHDCFIRNLSFRSADQIPEYLQRFGLMGAIWVEPVAVEMAECLSCLREKNFPLIGCSASGPETFLSRGIDSNFVAVDNRVHARERVRFLADRSCRYVTGLLIPSRERDLIEENLNACGIRFRFFASSEDFTAVMPALMKKDPVDGILCDGYSNFYRTLFRFLHEQPDFHPVLSMEDHPRVRALMAQYPEVRIEFPFEPWQDWLAKLGIMAAEMLLKSVSEGRPQPFQLSSPSLRTRRQGMRKV